MTSPKEYLAKLATAVREGQARVSQEHPDAEKYGATLFLGKCFADRYLGGVLMLGLNPGAPGHYAVDIDRLAYNPLLEPPPPGENDPPYWRNARTLFTATRALKSKMEKATFSFCVPYRTKTSGELSACRIGESAEVMRLLFAACTPRYIIAAGKRAYDLILCDERLSPCTSRTPRTKPMFDDLAEAGSMYRRRKTEMPTQYGSAILIQVPHFSRANGSERLQEIGCWLDKELV